jgi:hypothetical protein
LFLNAAHCANRRSGETSFGYCRSHGCNSLLKIRVEQFVRIQLRRIAGKIENFDLFGVPRQPALDQLRVVNSQVVQNQKYLLPLFARQALEKADQDLRIQRAGEYFPAHFALVGYRRNHAQALAAGVDPQQRSLPFGRGQEDQSPRVLGSEEMQTIRKIFGWLLGAVIIIIVVLDNGTSPDDQGAKLANRPNPIWLQIFHRWEFVIDSIVFAICVVVAGRYVYSWWQRQHK